MMPWLALLSCWALNISGNDILTLVDQQLEKTKSQVMVMDMAIEDRGHEPRRIGFQMHMRGEQRRIAFLYPGDMKGMRVLNLAADKTYVYLPAFRKVRRIASHLREQTMFGSDYTFDDFNTIGLHKAFEAAITGEDEQHWRLDATPRMPSEGGYKRIALQVNKSNNTVEELRYYNAAGAHVRTETRSDYTCTESGCAPRKSKMVDHRHDDHWTEVTIKDLRLNAPFSDQIFSLRALQPAD